MLTYSIIKIILLPIIKLFGTKYKDIIFKTIKSENAVDILLSDDFDNKIKKHLENGRPIIVNVGEGIFTDNGHYMVFVGWEDEKIRINDPNRRDFSERLWDFEEIQDQIKNMWVY